MNTTQIEVLLQSLPAEVLRAYENTQKLSSKLVSVYQEYSTFSRRATVSKYLFFGSFFGFLFSAGYFAPNILSASIGMAISTAAMIIAFTRASHNESSKRQLEQQLEDFRTAAEKGRLTEAAFSKLDLIRTRDLIGARLVEYARNVLRTENRFKEVRSNAACSVVEIVNAGQAVLEAQSQYNELLSRAVQFGLSDGDKLGHFGAASFNFKITVAT